MKTEDLCVRNRACPERRPALRLRTAVPMLAAVCLGMALCVPAMLPASAAGRVPYAENEKEYDARQETLQALRAFARQLCADNLEKDPAADFYTWDNEKKGYNWSYFSGFMIDAFLGLDDLFPGGENQALAERYYDACIGADGSIGQYRTGTTDAVEPARGLFDLLRDPSLKRDLREKCEKAVSFVYRQLEAQTSYPQCGGNFLLMQEPDGSPGVNCAEYQIYTDTLYMTQPFLAECAAAIDGGWLSLRAGDGREITAEELRAGITARYRWIRDAMWDDAAGLVQHGWNVDENRGNGHFWGRAEGWLAMSLSDAADLFPDGPEKEELEAFLKQLLEGLLAYREEESGLWYNVLNRDDSLAGNRTESSCSAMIACALLNTARRMRSSTQAARDGSAAEAGAAPEGEDPSLADAFENAGWKALESLAEDKISLVGGQYCLADTYLKSGVGDTDEYYLKEGYAGNEAKGIGALLMALQAAEEKVYEDGSIE